MESESNKTYWSNSLGLNGVLARIIELPSVEELRKCFYASGLDHFAEKTKIHKRLGSSKIPLMKILIEFDKSVYDYKKESPTSADLVSIMKDLFIRCILLPNYQEEYVELKELRKENK